MFRCQKLPAVVMALAACLALAGAAPPRPEVKLRLAAGDLGLAAGRSVDVGVVLTLPQGWHTYWDGLNDSGYPPRIAWDLPPGFTAGEPRWPVPHRHVSAGEILDHVLTGEVVALVSVTAPGDLAPATSAALKCRVEWLVCRDVCVPGRGEAALSLPVVAATDVRPDPAATSLLAEARANLPELLTTGSMAAAGVRWQRDGNIVTVEVSGARSLALMPSSDSARPVDLLQRGEVDGERLRLELRPEDAGRAVRGVLAVRKPGEGPTVYWQLDLPAEDQR